MRVHERQVVDDTLFVDTFKLKVARHTACDSVARLVHRYARPAAQSGCKRRHDVALAAATVRQEELHQQLATAAAALEAKDEEVQPLDRHRVAL